MPIGRDVTKVVIVDDSGLVRALLSEVLNSDTRLRVVGVAADPFEAREVIKRTNPDVITLDIEMPKMNGIAFLKNLMRLRPIPVVMISTLTQAGAPATLEALEHGAVDYLAKPMSTGDVGLVQYREQIIEKVLTAAKANVSPLENQGATASNDKVGVNVQKNKTLRRNFICFIGASTGGTEAIKEVLTALPPESPPILVTQHIPATFSSSFAQRLNNNSKLTVVEAENNMPIKPGHAYLAPGDDHLRVRKSAYGYICQIEKGDPVNRHRPSVEVLFKSAIETLGNNCMGVLLTGMGADGSQTLLEMREAGCLTIAQDEATSVVWGMPGVAVKLGGATKVLPLKQIASNIIAESYR
ncbi:protein-glutamate methylesterase/protein-glutamine glutaminase [Aurantivibrio plasticivorans]